MIKVTKLSDDIEIIDDALFIYSKDRARYTKLTGEGIEICRNDESNQLRASEPTAYEPYFDSPTVIMSQPPKFGKCNVVENETGIIHPYPMWLSDDSADALNYCVNDIMNTKKLEEKEGKNMELLRLYNKKSKQNINEFYDVLIEKEKENDIVQKAFDDLIDRFNEDLENLAKVYNPFNKVNGTYIEEEDFGDFEIPYNICHETTEKEQEINSMRVDELHKLDEKIEEINAHLQLLPTVETTSHEQVMEILNAYGVVNDVGQLTPYTPEAIGDACCEECKCEEKKHRGRPKKENN